MSRNLFNQGAIGLVLAVCALSGCSKNSDKPAEAANPPAGVTPVPVALSLDPATALHQPFSEATVAFGPTGSKRPARTTAAGKDIGAIYEQIAGTKDKPGIWNTIRFLTPAGKPIQYQAVIKTDLGDIRLELFPQTAPNQVRNFIALARVGYYDGLAFDFINRSKVGQEPWTFVVAGCPLGTFERGTNLGYWLMPEIGEIAHEEGTVGAWNDGTLESPGCKFYINVDRASWMDGSYTIFGKVTHGLDIVRHISQAPLNAEEASPGGTSGRPQQPVIIRRVAIEQKE